MNPSTSMMIRSLAFLAKAGKELECDHLTILTWDYKAEEKHTGRMVNFLPLWRWLIKI
jgi:predicted AAA+ superfamily ATPase